jgi:YGGT family
MTVENIERTVTTAGPPPGPAQSATPVRTAHETVRTDSHMTSSGPARPELGRRITVLVFGLIQLVIGARFVLLLLDAREGNALVSGILNLSQIFVGPFEGILRTNALHAGGSTFDVAAIVAIVGWTVVEFVVIKALAIFRRETV